MSKPLDQHSTHDGGGRGAGAPRGPRPATVERQAAIYALFNDSHERALLASISPLDIIEVAARRLLADGHLYAAAHLAAFAAPNRHYRKRTLTTYPTGLPTVPPRHAPADRTCHGRSRRTFLLAGS